ncbi:MAG: S-layer homology domain-containing protein [Defluviitaleaceae bacterium]|nr:S-layer homology domain-containing protein [Defluviitaleaceae bacterium]
MKLKWKLQRTLIGALAATMMITSMAVPAYAVNAPLHTVGNDPVIGQMGFFGGTATATRLPQTTERRIALGETRARTRTGTLPPRPYREIVFLDGTPREFEGVLRITPQHMDADSRLGTLSNERYVVESSIGNDNDNVEVARNIAFNINYRIEGNQVIRDYRVNTWLENIWVDGVEFILDPYLSEFVVSVIEDRRAAVTFYRGDISVRAVYVEDGEWDYEGARRVVDDRWGSFYGFRSAWSAVETHRIDSIITATGPFPEDNWEMQVQMRPSASVSKSLQFAENEPTMISFLGNYREVMQTTSAMEWNIFHRPQQFSQYDDSGRMYIPTFNTFEQLIAPNLSFLRGHPAQADITRLFSMQILGGEPSHFRPDQAMTRGQFTTALVRAMNLPLPEQTPQSVRRRNVPVLLFPDVPSTRPEFPYIMAARNVGLAVGREDGQFHIDSPLDRQEAIALMVRALGLEDMGIFPASVTPFADDASVSPWARRELYVAEWIGLISGDDDGNIRPRDWLTNAEGAAIINRFVEYMRFDLAMDYAEHIVNYAR